MTDLNCITTRARKGQENNPSGQTGGETTQKNCPENQRHTKAYIGLSTAKPKGKPRYNCDLYK